MKTFFCFVLLFGMSLLQNASGQLKDRPNIVYVLADDLGYGDIGAFGQQKIRTPHLDHLAAQGLKFTQNYAGSNVCAPSRCVLLTGLHPGHAFIRDNRELKTEGQLPIPDETVTLPELLKKQGYVTGAFGKWGLGGPGSTGDPLNQGFDRFFGYNCQRAAHNFYPTYLWDNKQRVPLNNHAFAAHQKLPADADPNDPKSYEPYQGKDYAPDLIMAQARRFINDNKNRPFFLYVPTTVPHLALQVPDDSFVEYQNSFVETPYTGGRGYLPNFTPRATYAAMITRMDREIGALMQQIHDLKLDDKTIFIFTSDNGPLFDKFGGTDDEFFNSHGGLRGRKGSFYEGGFRVPLIVRWTNHIQPNTISHRVVGFEDWLPTLLEIAGSKPLKNTDGISFLPTLMGKEQAPRPFLYRESPGYGGQQYVRIGDWAGVRQKLNQKKPDLKIQLFNLKKDPAQQKDVAAQNPALVAQIETIMREEHALSKEFPMPALDSLHWSR
jgi:arylsulfatase A-like enzyme